MKCITSVDRRKKTSLTANIKRSNLEGLRTGGITATGFNEFDLNLLFGHSDTKIVDPSLTRISVTFSQNKNVRIKCEIKFHLGKVCCIFCA